MFPLKAPYKVSHKKLIWLCEQYSGKIKSKTSEKKTQLRDKMLELVFMICDEIRDQYSHRNGSTASVLSEYLVADPFYIASNTENSQHKEHKFFGRCLWMNKFFQWYRLTWIQIKILFKHFIKFFYYRNFVKNLENLTDLTKNWFINRKRIAKPCKFLTLQKLK